MYSSFTIQLVEGIDNAKNIQNMGLWPVLISLLEDTDRQVRSGIAWVCGTALQNNPDAQKAVSFTLCMQLLSLSMF